MSVDFKEYSRKMERTLSHLGEDFDAVRAGRANAKVLDRITVEYYGSDTPLNGVATISSPDARTLVITPWDTKLLKEIQKACEKCTRPSCINPQICPNLNTDHSKLIDIYRSVDALPGIRRSYIGSGVRYDLLLYRSKDENANRAAAEYTRELIERHVSGRLKVAPEHVADNVLRQMRKPPFQQFRDFKRLFDRINGECGLHQQIIPYFISSHPSCHEEDMAELAVITKDLDFHLEQVQDFTPTPMTISTEAWYTGYDPYTLEPVFSAKTQEEKLRQRQYFFWYKPEMRRDIERSLRALGRGDLIAKLWNNTQQRPALDMTRDKSQQAKNKNGNNRTTDNRERPKGQKRRPYRNDR